MVDIFLQKLNTNDEPIFTFVADNMLSFNIDVNTPVTAMPLPQESLEQQILLKIEGNSAVTSFSWTIKDQTSEIGSTFGSTAFGLRRIVCSGGTPPVDTDIGRVVTDDGDSIGYLVGIESTNTWLVATNKSPAGSSTLVAVGGTGSQPTTGSVTITQDLENFLTAHEQIAFFYSIFEPKTITDKYRLIVNDVDGTPVAQDGFFHQQTFRISDDAPVTYVANVVFYAGNSVAAFEADTPGPPIDVIVTPGSQQLSVSWTVPNTDGGSAISDYRVRYRKQGTFLWKNSNVGSATTSKTVTGLEALKVYDVVVFAKNDAGYGQASAPTKSGRTTA